MRKGANFVVKYNKQYSTHARLVNEKQECSEKEKDVRNERPYCIDLVGGDEGDRTPDLMNAIHALSQLSYVPSSSFGFRV